MNCPKTQIMWSSNLDLYAQSAGRKTLHYPCSFGQKSQYLKILIPLTNDLITIYCCISNRLDYHCSLVSGLCSYLWGGGGGKGGSSTEFGCVTVKFTQFPRKVLYYSNDPSLLIGSGNHVAPKLLCPSLPPPLPMMNNYWSLNIFPSILCFLGISRFYVFPSDVVRGSYR